MFKVTVPEIKVVFFKVKCGTALVSSGNGVGHGDSRLQKGQRYLIQELQPALNVNVSSEKLVIRRAFPLCHLTDSFLLKRLKYLLQMFLS